MTQYESSTEDPAPTRRSTMVFCGDFAPSFGYEAQILRGVSVLKELKPLLHQSTHSFANVEAVLCEYGRPIAKVGPHLRAHPRTVEALADVGFGIAGLANNHSMDFGLDGLEQTIASCANSDLRTCGAGTNSETAARPLILRGGDVTLGLIAVAEEEFNRAGPATAGTAIADPIDIVRQVQKVRGLVDFTVVTLHGGNELFPFPRPGLRRLCHFLVENGVDAIICHHNHVPSAYEYYLEKPIVYGLGNLLFDNIYAFPEWEIGYAAKLEFRMQSATRAVQLSLTPFQQNVQMEGLRLLEGAKEAEVRALVEGRSETLADIKLYHATWQQFCDSKLVEVYTSQFVPFRFRGMQRASTFLPFHLWFNPTSLRLRRLNNLRCESHRELLQSLLEKT